MIPFEQWWLDHGLTDPMDDGDKYYIGARSWAARGYNAALLQIGKPEPVNQPLLEALKELRDWYKEHTGLPAVAANAAIAAAEAGRQAEPVAWIERRFLNGELIMSVIKDQKMPELDRARLAEHYDLEIVPLYTAPPAWAVPDVMPVPAHRPEIKTVGEGIQAGFADGWNACRAAMLAAAPKPEGGGA